MKNICTIMLLTAMALSLAACQATPEEVIVVQKDTERLVEMAQATPQPEENAGEPESGASGEERLRERLGIPERYEDTIQQEGDKLKVIVAADVQVPSEDHIPAARAQAGNFSQELVSRIYDRLIGDTPIYQFTNLRSKADVEKDILQAQKQLAEADNEQKIEKAEYQLRNLRKEYEISPEEQPWEKADDTLLSQRREFEETAIIDGSQTYLNIMENPSDGIRFSVFNNVVYDTAVGVWDSFSFVDEQGNTQIFTPSSGATLEFSRCGYQNSLIENHGGYVHADATTQSLSGEAVQKSRLSMTAKEARDMVEALISELGIENMEVDKVSLVADVYPGEPEDDAEQAWQCTMLRTINGVRIVSDLESTYADGTVNSAEWMNECFRITVDDSGIRDIYWGGPLDVTEIVAESSEMLPFEQIRSIFENMMRVQYEPLAREFNGIEYRITRIRLSLQRISEADSFTTGLIVPVWNFYGTEIISSHEYIDESPWPLMTINGIDGSVIDIHKGY